MNARLCRKRRAMRGVERVAAVGSSLSALSCCSKHLAIGTDFHAVMREAIEESEADGWTVENDGACGFFFCNRGGERREVRIQPMDPSEPVPLNNTSARRTSDA
jgi:hypothetical protein